MGVTLLACAAVAAAMVLRILLELRLKNHHPEVRRTLIAKPILGGNRLFLHVDNRLLMRFLVSRAHRTMNDRALSLIADTMLFIAGAFMLVMIGVLVSLGSILLPGGDAAK